MNEADVAIVGAGAAGLATAIFAARRNDRRSIFLLDGAHKLGAKILVSGGGRCNVTNAEVLPDDFDGTSPHTIRKVLSAFPERRAVTFFRELGVALHEEAEGKLFPDTNRARTVLDALLGEAARLGVEIRSGHRVHAVHPDGGFRIEHSQGTVRTARVVLATGGRSLPKSGSDGTGYRIAEGLGHSIVPTTPALVPLLLEGDFHSLLTGISHVAELELRAAGWKPVRVRRSMLWTHFGISGPAAMDISRWWLRARLEGRNASLFASFLPGEDRESLDRTLRDLTRERPKLLLRNAVAERLPARLADRILESLRLDGDTALAHLRRDDRRRLIEALLAWPLPVRDSRGYNFAEVTAGGIPLDEIDPSTMASRKCPGLFLVGEILDVDGRIGGFNFQWSWSSGFVAGSSV